MLEGDSMPNTLEKYFAIILVVLLLFIEPQYRFYRNIDFTVNKLINDSTREFVNDIRNKGYISKEMYENYIIQLSNTRRVYDIKIIHTKYVYYPLNASHSEYSIDKPYVILNEQYSNFHILDTIFNQGENYYMNKDDDIVVHAYDNTPVTGTKVFLNTLGIKNYIPVFARYGGGITNEAY